MESPTVTLCTNDQSVPACALCIVWVYVYSPERDTPVMWLCMTDAWLVIFSWLMVGPNLYGGALITISLILHAVNLAFRLIGKKGSLVLYSFTNSGEASLAESTPQSW